MSNNTKLLCLLLKAQKVDKSSEQGYAMAMVSMVSVIMFSLLSATLIFSNLSKNKTDAFVDSSSSFAIAEAGLNKRGNEFRKKLDTYSGVIKGAVTTDINTCLGTIIPENEWESALTPTGFGCRNYRFNSGKEIAKVASSSDISLGLGSDAKKQDENTYLAYTLISDRTDYGLNGKSPQPTLIPTGDPFQGLNASEYKYVLESTGKKPVDSAAITLPEYTGSELAAIKRQERDEKIDGDDDLLKSAEEKKNIAAATTASASADISSNNISLSMTFINRVVPLFQFGIFYNGDMELNSTSSMQMKGWVHSNANIYVQPAGVSGSPIESSITTFLSNVSAAGRIYNRVDAWDNGIGRTGITRVLLTGTSCAGTLATPSNCQDIPAYNAAIVDPLEPSQINAFPDKKVQDRSVSNSLIELKTPSAGFTRKRNYFNNKIGTYYSQADMRLEMVPDRDVTVTTTNSTPWTRNQAIIPFNFTAIRTGGSDVCTTATPGVGSDPAAKYIDPNREDASALRCTVFTKGQLQSLRQPVMVLTNINQPDPTLRGIGGSESSILGIPKTAGVATLPAIPINLSTAVTGNLITKKKILRALQVALVSTPSPVPLERLNTPFNQPAYLSGSLNVFKEGFRDLLIVMGLSAADRFNLLDNSLVSASPNQIAALGDAWFLPAPIQRVERPTPETNTAENTARPNLRGSGFYDGREERWITMLQTNIASLSVWNRDGIYVDPTDPTLTTAYATNNTFRSTAFANANTFDAAHALDSKVVFNGANGTDGLAFDRAITIPTGITPKGLQTLGLGSTDATEGGLVFHATVSDNLNGNSSTNDANDVTINTTNPIYKKNADNTDYQDLTLPAATTDKRVIIDYYRKYPGVAPTETKKSPFAFAFNGGDYLPNALLLSSDQSIYIQGDFNNNGKIQAPNTSTDADELRLPAAVVADTITALSNQCAGTNANLLGVPLGQLKCGLPPTINGSSVPYDRVTSAMSINAAFLSNTQVSNGNKGTGRYDPSISKSYSGGVNNYIRLLEDWNNNDNAYTLNYTGSLISLGSPLEYSGLYKAGGGNLASISYYNVPFRNINYDPFFNNVEKLPPLTPKASYIMQKNFSRVY